MNNCHSKTVSKLLLLFTVITFSLSLILSCGKNEETKKPEEHTYVAGSADEIRNNIANSVATEGDELNSVLAYLLHWGVGNFDKEKFSYFEYCVTNIYNFGDGLPKIEDHAKSTAELYLEAYYNEIDGATKFVFREV